MTKAKRAQWKLLAKAFAAMFLFASNADAQTTSATTPSRPAYRELKDEAGRTVRIPEQVRRIVSLAPSVTETLYALGFQDRLVGDTDYCDYPPEAQKKTKVGGTINPSIEQIVALKPDLVLMAKSSNRLETVAALDNLGIPSYATDAHNVDEIVSSTEKLADVLGAAEAGISLGVKLRRQLLELQQHIEGVTPSRVLFVVWAEPLISIGKHTFIADALLHAGAVSVVDVDQGWPRTSLEEVVLQQPEFLVVAVSHSQPAPIDLEALSLRPGWRDLEAVKNHRFAVISDAVNRPAPRIISAIEELAHQLHPEAFIENPKTDNDKLEKDKPQPPQSNTGSAAFHAAPRPVREGSCAL